MRFAIDFIKRTKIREFDDRARELEKETGKKVIKAYIGNPKYTDNYILEVIDHAVEYYIKGNLRNPTIEEERLDKIKKLVDESKKEINPRLYSNFRGMECVRKVIAEKENRKPSEIFITNGAMEALGLVIQAVAHGQKVLFNEVTFHPYYKYLTWLAAGTPQKYTNIDDAIQKIKNEDIAAVVVTTPNNPTGEVVSNDDIERLADVAEKKDTWVILDRVYKNLGLYKDIPPAPVRENIIELYSMSKDIGYPAMRIGHVIGTSELIEKLAAIGLTMRASVNNISQVAFGAAYLNLDLTASRRKELREKIDALTRNLKGNVEYNKPEGALYAWIKVPTDGYEFAKRLLEEKFIAVTPGFEFHFDVPEKYPYIRITFGSLTVEEAEIVGKAVSELANEY